MKQIKFYVLFLILVGAAPAMANQSANGISQNINTMKNSVMKMEQYADKIHNIALKLREPGVAQAARKLDKSLQMLRITLKPGAAHSDMRSRFRTVLRNHNNLMNKVVESSQKKIRGAVILGLERLADGLDYLRYALRTNKSRQFVFHNKQAGS